MKLFLYLISLLWIAAGACYILYTKESRSVFKKTLTGINRKLLSAIPAVAGILLIFAAFSSRNSWFIILIGILAVGKGLFIYLNPNNQFDRVRAWLIDTATDEIYRLFGIVGLILGTALFSWIL